MSRLDARLVDEFWRLVEETLQNIFHRNPADTRIDDLRAQIDALPDEEEELFYHAEALDVAGDLAQVSNEALHAAAKAYDLLKIQVQGPGGRDAPVPLLRY
jgi:hypothetical protein